MIRMNRAQLSGVTLFVSAALSAAAALAEAPIAPTETSHEPPAIPKELVAPQPPRSEAVATDEEAESPQSSSLNSVHENVIPSAGTTLSPPVTITYSGSSNAVTINDSGSNRGLSSSLTS